VQRLISQLEGVILVKSRNGWTHFSIQLPLPATALLMTGEPQLSR
jgi:nitrogen-specific signal transduction histidine kinase